MKIKKSNYPKVIWILRFPGTYELNWTKPFKTKKAAEAHRKTFPEMGPVVKYERSKCQ